MITVIYYSRTIRKVFDIRFACCTIQFVFDSVSRIPPHCRIHHFVISDNPAELLYGRSDWLETPPLQSSTIRWNSNKKKSQVLVSQATLRCRNHPAEYVNRIVIFSPGAALWPHQWSQRRASICRCSLAIKYGYDPYPSFKTSSTVHRIFLWQMLTPYLLYLSKRTI